MKKIFLVAFLYLAFSGTVSGLSYFGPYYYEGASDVSVSGIVTNLNNATNMLAIPGSVCSYTLYFGTYPLSTGLEGQNISVGCPGTWNLSNLNLNLETISGSTNVNGDGNYWLELRDSLSYPVVHILHIEYIRENGKWFSVNPWTIEPTGYSNVLFLPGLEASRLYVQKTVLGVPVEDQLWEPNFPTDVNDLFLDQNGNSLKPGIYTKDVIDSVNTAPILYTQKIYEDLIKKLDNLVSTWKINNWKAYAYDWRQGIDDLVQNGTKYNDDQTITLIGTLQSLVDTSKTGKVTIIAHSNGGLLAKALIKKLEDDKVSGKNDLVDHIDMLIMVASPQLGTPDAFSGLLNGYNQSVPVMVSGIQARDLGQNMPSAYGLLPSEKYFEQTGISSVATFTPTAAQMERTAYGSDINNYQEEHDFVLGKEGRTQPAESDLISPTIGNATLLTQAESLHDSIDNMTFPSSIKVIDIAGWGKSTITGMTYTGSDIQPIYSIRGDETVFVPSALYGAGTKYWLDLSNSTLNHKDILEDPQLLDFITSIIQQEPLSFSIVTDTEPVQIGDRLHLSVHSPVTIGVTDKSGNFTGKICDDNDNCQILENIPGSTYQEFGEGKYLNLPQGVAQDVKLQGTDAGTFTFNMQIVAPSGQTDTQSFIDIPVTTQTQADITLGQNGMPQMALDVDGDGKTDFTLTPSVTFDPITYLQIMRATIDSLDLTAAKIKAFDTRVDNIIKSIQKGKVDKAKLKVDKFETVLKNKLAKPDPKKPKPKKLSKTDAQTLLDMLNTLLDNLS